MLPWLESTYQDLHRRAAADTLPHALLISAPRGYGKAPLAQAFAHDLLCQTPDARGRACGHCKACLLLRAGTHPDLMPIRPEEEGKAITVDSIRAVGEYLALKGHYGNRQIAIIDPAEAMNRSAANSLLKTLEEPTHGALLLLISSRPSLLLPTIRSRCQQVTLKRPPADLAQVWLREMLGTGTDAATLLALADGAPLEALRLHESGGMERRGRLAQSWLGVIEGKVDPLAGAAGWGELNLSQACQWLASWVMDLIRLKSGVPAVAIVNADLARMLPALAEKLELKQLFNGLDQITEYTRWAEGQLNSQLALEDIMITWSRSAGRSTP